MLSGLSLSVSTFFSCIILSTQSLSLSLSIPGVILSIGVSPDPGNNTFMIVLDARTMKELARAEVNVIVHRDFHGEFYANSGLGQL